MFRLLIQLGQILAPLLHQGKAGSDTCRSHHKCCPPRRQEGGQAQNYPRQQRQGTEIQECEAQPDSRRVPGNGNHLLFHFGDEETHFLAE